MEVTTTPGRLDREVGVVVVVVHLGGLEAAAGLVVLELGAVEEGAQDEDEDGDGACYDADHHGRHGALVGAAAEGVVVIGLVVAADALGHVCGWAVVLRWRVGSLGPVQGESLMSIFIGLFGLVNLGNPRGWLGWLTKEMCDGESMQKLLPPRSRTVTKVWAVRCSTGR